MRVSKDNGSSIAVSRLNVVFNSDLGLYLNRLVMKDCIRYSFEYTDLRLRHTLDGEFFKHIA